VQHSTTIQQLGEGTVQAVCSCGWRSPVFGADKRTGTMDPLQHATEAADLHEWEMSLRLAHVVGFSRIPRMRLASLSILPLTECGGSQ